jgi:hypothetical protein
MNILQRIRSKIHNTRRIASGQVGENLPFAEIEKKYLGRAINFQLENWRTISDEPGSLYCYYDTKNGESMKGLILELSRKVFLGFDAGIFSAKGIVYNNYYNCTVLETVEEWGNDVNLSTEYTHITKKPSRVLKGLSVSLLSLGAINNYAHFLFDSISRLVLFESLPKEIDWFLLPGPQRPWKEKILAHLGISSRVIWVNEREELNCEQLLFTTRVNYSRHCSPFAIRAMRRLFLPDEKKVSPSRMIFASRKNAADRKHPYETIIHAALPSAVEVVEFENLSMEETIRICQQTKFFIGIHGAAFANLAFCPPGTRVLELQIGGILPEWHRNYYQTIGDYLSFDHHIQLMGENIGEHDLQKMISTLMEEGIRKNSAGELA